MKKPIRERGKAKAVILSNGWGQKWYRKNTIINLLRGMKV